MRYSLALTLALVGCDNVGGTATATPGATVAESGTKRGSAGGFSATLAQELGPPEAPLGAAAPSAQPATQQAAANKGSAPAAAAEKGATAPAPTASPSGAPAAAGKPAAGAASAAGAAPATTAETSAPAPTKGGAAAPPPAAAAATPEPAAGAPAATGGKGRAYVKPSGDLAAIKFDLEPNWERDFGEAGTFSLVVKVPNSDDTRVFSVHYGYDDPNAPFDCDQYRKFLEDNKIMNVTLNRQRGGACYVESASGFRYLVNYGGKRLMCRGSLYKDSGLGDLRDKVLMQAKKICETLAL